MGGSSNHRDGLLSRSSNRSAYASSKLGRDSPLANLASLDKLRRLAGHASRKCELLVRHNTTLA